MEPSVYLCLIASSRDAYSPFIRNIMKIRPIYTYREVSAEVFRSRMVESKMIGIGWIKRVSLARVGAT